MIKEVNARLRESLLRGTTGFILYLYDIRRRNSKTRIVSRRISEKLPCKLRGDWEPPHYTLHSSQIVKVLGTRVRSGAHAEMYFQARLSYHPVCGRRLAPCLVLKNKHENVKQ